jgi:DNA polymerase elongation subunit (family B)
MYYRYLKLYNKSGTLAEVLSPIKLSHSGSGDYPDAKYPCGISIMDYLAMFKKVFMREPSYTLDAISQKYINDKSWGASNFGELTQDIRDKNVNDVVRMQKLEDKFKLIDYFDEIRILTKTEWEDLIHNSFIVENLLFQEAKRMNIVLPNRPKVQDDDEEPKFEGAFREAFKTGALFDIGKFDLTSAYPTMMVEFCLDSTNIVTDDSGIDINGTKFQQNPSALIPSMMRRIMELKDTRKEELSHLKKGTNEYTTAKIKYDAIKGVVNSGFGAMGFSSFRLYDNRVASAITYLVRELLDYSGNEIKKMGHEVVYADTDSVFLTCKDDISDKLNQCIQDWASTKGKSSINLKYEYEGYFSKIFIIALCRYVGHLVSKKGTEVEIKGAEAKRASSTKYEGQFQLALIDKMLAKETQESILTWIEKERNQLRLYPLEEVSFPCKISNKEYKVSKKTGRAVYPIFMRAVDNTNAIKKLDVPVGELLWWAYVEPILQSDEGKDVDVLAFTKDDKDVVRQHKVDWSRMIARNIDSKAENIFKAQGWSVEQLQNEGQLSLF